MRRRKFFNWAGIGLLASYFPIALAACSQEAREETSGTEATTKPTTQIPDADGYTTVGTAQELTENGYLIDSKSNLIVFRNSNNNLTAVSTVCTHQGCKLDWKNTSNSLFCSCHGSEFASDGKVLNGPAQSPLSSFEVKEEQESILVKVS